MKKYSFVTLIVIAFCFFSSSLLYAQNDGKKNESPFNVSCDLMSRYVWRGTDFGNSPSIQPGIEYTKAGFVIGTWGAYAVNRTGLQEVDLYLGYTYKELVSLTVTDYFFPNEDSTYDYFDYKNATTGHVLEGTISFNGTNNLPISVLLATNFWGADAKRVNSDGSIGKIQYSTYAEIKYSFEYLDVFMGANLTNADTNKDEVGYYGNNVGIVNLGITATKNIPVTKRFSLPLTVSFITNPQARKIYLVAGFLF